MELVHGEGEGEMRALVGGLHLHPLEQVVQHLTPGVVHRLSIYNGFNAEYLQYIQPVKKSI